MLVKFTEVHWISNNKMWVSQQLTNMDEKLRVIENLKSFFEGILSYQQL